MKIRLIQVYIEVGIVFEFSCEFQNYISKEISKHIVCSENFEKKYGDDYTLVFFLSAKKDLNDLEIKGPGVYRKNKQIEYTIFLPYLEIQKADCFYKCALEYLFMGIKNVLNRYNIDIEEIENEQDRIIQQILNDPNMINI